MLSNCNGCQALSKKLIGSNDQKMVEMVEYMHEAGRMYKVFEQSLVGWKDSWDAREKYWNGKEAEYQLEIERLKTLAEESAAENKKSAAKVANLSNMLTEVKPMFRAAASSEQQKIIDKLTEQRNIAWEYIRCYELNERTEEQISTENNARLQKIEEELEKSKELVNQLKGTVNGLEDKIKDYVTQLLLTYTLITQLTKRAELAESAQNESGKRLTMLEEQLTQAKNQASEFKTKHDKMLDCYQTNKTVMAASRDWIARRDRELTVRQEAQIAEIEEKESTWKKEDEANLLKILALNDKVRELTLQLAQLEETQASTESKYQEELEELKEKCKKMEAEKELEERKKKKKMEFLRELVALEEGTKKMVEEKSLHKVLSDQ